MSQPSQAQVDANRRNAKYGHGPNTPRGKGRSSQNALRHGLAGRIVVLPTEDMEAYNAFSKELIDSLNPANPMERQLAQTVSDTQWRLNRARTYEDGMLALGPDPALSAQYSGADGNFGRADTPEMHSALTAANVFRENSKTFVNLSLYEQRLSRAHKDAFRQLRELQPERKTMEMRLSAASAPESAKVPRQTTTAGRMTPIPVHTSEAIGFVYSNGQDLSPEDDENLLRTEYDPGAFDPIFFKNSIPVRPPLRIPDKKAA